MKKIFLFILITIPVLGYCQLFPKGINTDISPWFEGTITTSTGEKKTGKLNYNFSTGLLRMKNGKAKLSFHAKSVARFSLEQPDGTKDYYFALPYNRIGEKGGQDFFQVEESGKNYAVLSSFILRNDISQSPNFPGEPSTTKAYQSILKQIFVLHNGTMYLIMNHYVGVKNKKQESVLDVESNSMNNEQYKKSVYYRKIVEYKIQDKRDIETITGVGWKNIVKLSKSNDWEIQTVDGLNNVLEYYLEN